VCLLKGQLHRLLCRKKYEKDFGDIVDILPPTQQATIIEIPILIRTLSSFFKISYTCYDNCPVDESFACTGKFEVIMDYDNVLTIIIMFMDHIPL
jgi:hypothetical protein